MTSASISKYGISVYALEKNKMIAGNPNARAVQFFLDSDVVPLNLIGDGLLPADIDGTKQPKEDAAIPIVGTQDPEAGYGATFDAVNIWDLKIHWQANPVASIEFRGSLPVAPSTRSSRARRPPATACRSRASSTRLSTSTSFPTASGRPGALAYRNFRTTSRS